MKLTDRTLAALRCPEGKKDALFFDEAEPGFGVRVTADGKRVFLFQYRVGRQVRRHRIGVWGQGDLTATRARQEAERLRGDVNRRGDPVAERRAAQEAALAADAAAKAQRAEEAFTFFRLVDAWKEKGLAHRRPRYAQDAVNRLRAYFADWKDRPASSITRAETVRAVDRIEAERGTTSARRGLAYARAAYGWAVKRNMLEQNPFSGIAAPGKENPRDRVLSGEETGAIWRAAGSLGPITGPYVRLLLLTLQRREEVAGLRWSEITPDLSIWTLPAERAKNGRAHLIHLAEPARELLRTLPRLAECDFVFPGRSSKRAISAFSFIKAELDAAIEAERQEAGIEPAALAPWWFHDFRRTGVTALAGMGFPPHVCDRLLNHLTGAIQGVAAVYQRHEFLAEREAALNAWAAHVLRMAEKREPAGNVVALAGRRG